MMGTSLKHKINNYENGYEQVIYDTFVKLTITRQIQDLTFVYCKFKQERVKQG